MSSPTELDAVSVVLLVVGAIVALPMIVMALGFGGMMGYGGMMGGGAMGAGSGWWPLFGLLVPLLFLLVLLGGGYVLARRLVSDRPSRDAALEELRVAYARGDLTDEEFETRRERLERSE
ncbi:putative membrane protein [Halomicrobium zhouii]|uniref:Putative membrane protein n=1 Tax=Halomicrobium zhouii TaxID=767519 RepID=A0A1I6M3D7_9EURY|nr:SHOCT domain-containing protein [Halomicrobium zhouii]SFS10196.1 putative membrane protein [Halomicrobium zhouii]